MINIEQQPKRTFDEMSSSSVPSPINDNPNNKRFKPATPTALVVSMFDIFPIDVLHIIGKKLAQLSQLETSLAFPRYRTLMWCYSPTNFLVSVPKCDIWRDTFRGIQSCDMKNIYYPKDESEVGTYYTFTKSGDRIGTAKSPTGPYDSHYRDLCRTGAKHTRVMNVKSCFLNFDCPCYSNNVGGGEKPTKSLQLLSNNTYEHNQEHLRGLKLFWNVISMMRKD